MKANPTDVVLVSTDSPILTYHDPSGIESHEGCMEMTAQAAREKGAVECYLCFQRSKVTYNFPYCDSE
jgi:hypothetical protein